MTRDMVAFLQMICYPAAETPAPEAVDPIRETGWMKPQTPDCPTVK